MARSFRVFGQKEPGDPEVRFSCSALGFRVLRLKGGGFGNSEALNPEPETPTGEKSETPSPAFGVQGVGMLDTDSPKPYTTHEKNCICGTTPSNTSNKAEGMRTTGISESPSPNREAFWRPLISPGSPGSRRLLTLPVYNTA